jgi:hypothetical protein
VTNAASLGERPGNKYRSNIKQEWLEAARDSRYAGRV